jgi:hypothetical protein
MNSSMRLLPLREANTFSDYSAILMPLFSRWRGFCEMVIVFSRASKVHSLVVSCFCVEYDHLRAIRFGRREFHPHHPGNDDEIESVNAMFVGIVVSFICASSCRAVGRASGVF